MIDDEHHEAHGAMIHRALVEERTNTRNYHREQKEALDVAIAGLEEITADVDDWSDHAEIAAHTLKKIKEILK